MFVMSYFRTKAEALHLAVSEDGLKWRALNDNQPVLTGSVGDCTMRDPFILPTPLGFQFFSTNGWNSDCIVHTYSEDLISWSDQVLLPVMKDFPGTLNSWAPECFRDEEANCWRVIWSSTVSPSLSKDKKEYDHRIWGASTPDFRSFAASSVFFDPGYSVIDATVTRDSGLYRMVFKDERGENRRGTENKAMRITTASRGTGPWTTISELVTPSLTEGPTLYRLASGEWVMLFDCFMDHWFGAAKSHDGGTTWEDITPQITFPEGPRHATVFEAPEEIYEQLVRQWG